MHAVPAADPAAALLLPQGIPPLCLQRACDFSSPQDLEYLNLGINNISRIEGLDRCESLRKIDLTLNFIPASALPGVASLAGLEFLRELHLMGNPCTEFPSWRQYIISKLPRLTHIVSVWKTTSPTGQRRSESSSLACDPCALLLT